MALTRSSTNFMEPMILLIRWPVRSWKLQASMASTVLVVMPSQSESIPEGSG